MAERVFGQIEGFSGFGFPKAHSAAFGLLAYQSMWLRVHYGPELLCALLNEQPMGFYPPDALVHEAQRRGVEILPPDVNVSEVDCRETAGAAAGSSGNPPVRIGLGYVAELTGRRCAGGGRGAAARRPYRESRTSPALGGRRRGLQRLAWAGACEALGGGRAAPASDLDLRRPALGGRRGCTGGRADDGAQLALPLDGSPTPELPRSGPGSGSWPTTGRPG